MFDKYKQHISLFSRNQTQVQKGNKLSRLKALFLLAIIFTGTITALPVLNPAKAGALDISDSDPRTFDGQIKSLLYYRTIKYCLTESELYHQWDLFVGNEYISASDAKAFRWFDNDNSAAIGLYMKDSVSGMDSRGFVNCANTSLISSALNYWGLGSSAAEVLCNSGFKREGVKTTGDNDRDVAQCINAGTSNFIMSGSRKDSANKFADFIKKRVYGGRDIPSLNSAQLYVYYLHSLDQGCVPNLGGVPGIDGSYTAPSTDTTYEKNYDKGINDVSWADTTAKPATVKTGSYSLTRGKYQIGLVADPDQVVEYTAMPTSSCVSIAKKMSDHAGDFVTAYNQWASNNKEDAQKIEDEAGNTSNKKEEGANSGETCNIQGIGWALCPLMSFVSDIVDAAYKMVASLLAINPMSLQTDESNGTYKAWQIMRDIANGLFAIAFLIIIFSQITSFGISNYGIKKMLPRLIIAAILVNISYYICAIAVDLSNILGASLKGSLENIANNMPGDAVVGENGAIFSITGGLMAGVVGMTAGYFLGWAIFLPALIAAFATIVTVLIALTLRKMLIILLIVTAPVAFVAFLLPNTEEWFKRWRELFTKLLIMFPAIAVIFGASKLASKIITSSSLDNSITDQDTLLRIMGAVVLIIPLALTPIIMKVAGGVMSRFGGLVNDPQKGIFDRMRKGAEGIRGREVNRMNNAAIHGAGGVYGLRNRFRRGGFTGRGGIRGQTRKDAIDQNQISELNQEKVNYISGLARDDANFRAKMVEGGGALAENRALARAIAQQDKIDEEVVSNRVMAISSEAGPGNIDKVASVLRTSIASGDDVSARAAQRILLKSGGKGKDTLHEVLGEHVGKTLQGLDPSSKEYQDATNTGVLKALRGEILASGIKGNDAVLDKWAAMGGNISNLEKDPSVLAGLSAEELASQSYKKVLVAMGGAGITQEAAKAVLKNPNASRVLNDEKRAFFESIAGYEPGSSINGGSPTGGGGNGSGNEEITYHDINTGERVDPITGDRIK